ncbi:hypothetical protein [Streptomyces sp. H27-C3]|nr:hypothetical protein [Streptomyces sp. H27-C3]MDJ0462786.1 hypothetical protein [Streptomyces sp. H27-C3]
MLIPVLIPVLVLGVLIGLGRYEDFMLTPTEAKERDPVRRAIGS